MIQTFKIFRFNPDEDQKPYYKNYQVEVREGMTILDVLNEIKWNQDGGLTFRRSCRHGICGSCAMTIDGLNRLACETQVMSLGRGTIEVEPLRHFPVIKDLAVDLDKFYEKYDAVKPYLIAGTPPTEKERIQSPEERKKIDGSYECILCAACTSSCPSNWANGNFLGPAALLKAYRFAFDSRDEGWEERRPILSNHHGLWRCHTIFNCTICPKSLNPTWAIAELKKKVIKEGL
ncbi:MAG: succinate dehydrogenase iron-sulfur subunit [Deltaproteobacteria bacterium]|nr:succinate dehydrogenase iron-sulfur subunit [Deltaproteobacteria bacterium]